MSGHSKWSKVKNQKAVTDAKKGKLYTYYAKRIAMAVKEGRGVQQVIDSAKADSVPREVIDRAVSRAEKRNAGGTETVYDGFFAGGKVALVIRCVTDNATRTSNEVRQILEHHGGKFGAAGSASYLFSKTGLIVIPNQPENLNAVLESSAQDFEEEDEELKVFTEVENLETVSSFLTAKNIAISNKEIIYRPTSTAQITDQESEALGKLIDSLQELDEVEDIFVNAE